MFKPDTETRFPAEPRSMNLAKYGLMLSIFALCAAAAGFAQVQKQRAPAEDPAQISGMYSFEHEGEFVQVTVEIRSAKADQTKPLAVTGFISRFADTESDRGAFLDYFIAKGALDGNKITFQTKTVHGISYGFTGVVSRGVAATRDKDGYYEIRGTLTQNTVSQDKIVSARTREITMKLFPDLDTLPAKAR